MVNMDIAEEDDNISASMTRLSQLDCASAAPHHLTSCQFNQLELFLMGFDFASVPQATYLQNVLRPFFCAGMLSNRL